ncbi:hypothetical protein SPLC1_S240690 [Arthrospira platensis C1]|nr:hypothetical protein SPLC1_S240690 [Arthrospira platensis C1]
MKRQRNPTNPGKMLGYIAFGLTYKALKIVGWVKRQRNPTNPGKMLGYIPFGPTDKAPTNKFSQNENNYFRCPCLRLTPNP